MTKILKYVELCTGANHAGPAWIGFAESSKSGRTVYFNGRAFALTKGPFGFGNSYDLESGDAYWISGVKKRGSNRHWAGAGRISISRDAVPAFLELTGSNDIDDSLYEVVDSFPETDKARFRELLNESWREDGDAG